MKLFDYMILFFSLSRSKAAPFNLPGFNHRSVFLGLPKMKRRRVCDLSLAKNVQKRASFWADSICLFKSLVRKWKSERGPIFGGKSDLFRVREHRSVFDFWQQRNVFRQKIDKLQFAVFTPAK